MVKYFVYLAAYRGEHGNSFINLVFFIKLKTIFKGLLLDKNKSFRLMCSVEKRYLSTRR